MAIKSNNVALGVRVKLNDQFKAKCFDDEYLMEEQVIFISDAHVYNDQIGQYILIKGGSLTNSGYAYLDQLDLEFPVPDKPLY